MPEERKTPPAPSDNTERRSAGSGVPLIPDQVIGVGQIALRLGTLHKSTEENLEALKKVAEGNWQEMRSIWLSVVEDQIRLRETVNEVMMTITDVFSRPMSAHIQKALESGADGKARITEGDSLSEESEETSFTDVSDDVADEASVLSADEVVVPAISKDGKGVRGKGTKTPFVLNQPEPVTV